MSPVSRSRSKKSKTKPAQAKGSRRSGNPAVRAEQAAEANLTDWRRLLGAGIPGWWTDSASAVLDACGVLRDGDSALAVENAVAAVLGTELASRLARHREGFDLPGWLVEIADVAGGRVASPSQDSAPALLLLHAIAACGTPKAADVASGHLDRLRPMLSEATVAAYPWLSAPARSAAPTAAPLAVRNAYGDRWAVLAPFAVDGAPETAHWYCLDIDACGTLRTVAAGVFSSAEDALAEWRSAVGPTADGATLEPAVDGALLRELLSEYLRAGYYNGFLDGFVVGDEPAELLAEYFRSRNRATALLESAGPRGSKGRMLALDRPSTEQILDAAERFAAWCEQNERGPLPDRESVISLADHWLRDDPTVWRYACSPHRIRHAAVLLTDQYIDEYAREMLALIPHWVAWCAEQTGLDAHHTELALATAHQVTTPEAVKALDRPEADAVRIIE